MSKKRLVSRTFFLNVEANASALMFSLFLSTNVLDLHTFWTDAGKR